MSQEKDEHIKSLQNELRDMQEEINQLKSRNNYLEVELTLERSKNDITRDLNRKIKMYETTIKTLMEIFQKNDSQY